MTDYVQEVEATSFAFDFNTISRLDNSATIVKRAYTFRFYPVKGKKMGVGGVAKLDLAFTFNTVAGSKASKGKVEGASFFILTSDVQS